MHNYIEFNVGLQKQEITITNTYIDINKDTIIQPNKFQSSTIFLYENNPELNNVFNEEYFAEFAHLSIHIHVENKNLEECIDALNNKLKTLFNKHFSYDFQELKINDLRHLNEHNQDFENIIDNFNNKKTIEENFKTIDNKQLNSLLEYTNKKISAFKPLMKTSSSSNIDMWIQTLPQLAFLYLPLLDFCSFLENL